MAKRKALENQGSKFREDIKKGGDGAALRTPDGEMFSFLCSASKKQEVLSFLREAVAADGPAPDALALLAAVCSGTGRRLLGTLRLYQVIGSVSPNPGD